MEIREYTDFDRDEIRRLYERAGWTAYTNNMPVLEQGFKNSLSVLAAYENGELLGIVRAVGDGCTVVFVQDILVFPDKRRRGVGTALMKAVLDRYRRVLQIELITDDTPETAAFYRSLGFSELSEAGCLGFVRFARA